MLFSTKAWEGDIDKILAGGFQKKAERCMYPFNSTMLVLNNIEKPIPSTDEIKDITGADRVMWAKDYAKKALDFFMLKEEDLGAGYIYSVCELVELYLADGFDYLCHFASDTLMHEPYDWITPSIMIMENCPDIITTAPNNEDSMIYGTKNQFFSDQVYLLKVKDWRKRDAFTYKTPLLPEYPSKGEELFERRAGRYLHNTGRYRQLIRDCWYDHPAF